MIDSAFWFQGWGVVIILVVVAIAPAGAVALADFLSERRRRRYQS